jgi:inositol transport system permease protein
MDVGTDRRNSIKKNMMNVYSKYGIVLVLMLIIIIFTLSTPNFLTVLNITNIVRQVSFIGLVGLGATFAIVSGGIDLSSGSVIAAASVVAAYYAKIPGVPVIIPVLMGMMVGIVIGAINGSMITVARIVPFIATLGTLTAAKGFALLYSDGRPISNLNSSYNYIGAGNILGVPIPIIIFIIAILVSWVLLSKTKFGKHVYAIGGNENAAIYAGVNIMKTKLIVYIYSSLLASVSAVVLTARVSSGNPGAGDGYELQGIAAAIIGGVSFSGGIGTIFGTVIGTLIIGVIGNGMDLLNVNMYWKQIVNGIIIVAAVGFDNIRNRQRL